MKNLRFRLVAVLLSLCLCALCFAGCAKSDSTDATSNTDAVSNNESTSNEDTAGVSRNQTLVWTVPSLPAGVDIYYNNGLSTFEAIRNIYDSVVYYPPMEDESGFLVPDFNNPQGMLAEELTMSEDGKTLTVKLKEGVISHEGNELVADDFIWERDRQTRLIGVANWQNDGMGISDPATQIKKIDKYTFSITTEEPNPILIPMMSHTANHIIDSVAFAAQEGAEDDPDGTIWSQKQGSGYGPYKISSFEPGDNITFVSHDAYWDESVPMYFKKVIMKEVPKSANRMALVLSGDADIATYLTPKELMEVEGAPGVKVLSWDSNFQTRIEFNCTKPPFDNPLVRKAIAYATPYQEILDTVYLGTAKQLKSVIPSAYPGFTDEFFKYEVDYDEAQRLLAEAGYADGFDTTITIMTEYSTQEQIAILVKDSLKKIGINVEIEKMQSADFWSQGPNKNFKGMYIFEDMPGVVDMGFSTKLWLQSGVDSNFSGYKNDELDRLYKETTQTVDNAVRAEKFQRIQEIAVWEDPAWVLLAEPGYHVVVREEIEGLFWQSLQEIRWANAYRAQ